MRSLIVVLVVVLAGCATQPGGPGDAIDPTDDGSHVEPAPTPWALALTDCTAVSGVSVYPRAQYSASAASPPEPFVPADIREDIGQARIASANGAGWFTATGEVAGHWHTGIQCAGLAWGYVGVRIDAPLFDEAPVDHNVLLAVWSWPQAIVDEMHHIAHATIARDVVATVDAGRMDMLLDDTDHGVYQGTAPRGEALAQHEAETIRFWMLIPAEGEHNHHDQVGPFKPVAFDMALTDYDQEVLLESVGVFAHTGTDHHAPLPGLGGNAAAVAWTGFDAVITAGPRPDVELNATWVH